MERDLKKEAIRSNIIIIVVFFGTLIGLALWIFPPRVPPMKQSVERRFELNQNAFQTVVDFLIQQKYDSIIIKDDSMMQADFQDVVIQDETVKKALQQIFALRVDMSVYKHANTIEFHWWTHPQNISSTLAYSINHITLPDVQFSTEMMQLSEPGWYYVIEDYNLWRQEH